MIEDTAEIQIKMNLVRFEARRTQNGVSAVTIYDLLNYKDHAPPPTRPNHLGRDSGRRGFRLAGTSKYRPQRNHFYPHANSAAQGISRFTTCVLQSCVEIPYRAIKTNITETLDVIVHMERRPGQRLVAGVLALRGFDAENDKYNFDFVYRHKDEGRNHQPANE
jgi:Flp pilus assembly CpaF family ATPase